MDYLYGKLNKTVKTVDSKIIYIPGEFNEVDVLNLYDTKEDGIYRIDSGLYGAELIIINKEYSLFRRINGEGDYSYDFINHEWIGLEGDISSISIDGVEQPVINKNVDLPAYPTKTSLGLNNVDNTSDLDKPISTATQTALNNKQTTLVSGENIKTINSQSLLGNGDIEIKSYRTFPVSWTKNDTTRDFCQDIENDTSAEPGDIYFGTLQCSDLPAGMIQAEATVEIISNGANGKCINITTTSLNTAPYRWNYSYGRVNGNITIVDWTGVQAEINATNKLSASLVSGLATVATTGSYSDLSNTPPIPAAQIQSDWAQTNSSKKDYIKNKPQVQNIYNSESEDAQSGKAVAMAVSGATESIQGYVANNYVAQENGKGLSTNDFTDTYKGYIEVNNAKVSNVQADWNANSGLAQILNKPSIYTQSEIDDFLVLEISLADIDPSHTVGGRPVIIPETATKIKSFKYRLKFQKILIDASASEDDYMILSPSDITNEYDDSIDPATGEPYGTWTAAYYSYISGVGAVLTPGNFTTVLFIETPDDLCVGGFTNNMIPATIMSSNGNLSLGDGDGGAIGSDIAFQEPLISGSNIKTINNQNILNSGNIEIPEISFIADINTTTGATNINGKNLSAYDVISYTSGDYTGYEIKQNNASLNETQAAQFLKGLTGNPILPVYNYDYPNNSYLIRATDGQILKPQYDSNGLKLYDMQKIVTNKTGMPYLTTAPTSDNLSGGLKFVVLSSEPQTKYNGYIYFITSNQNNN